VKPPAWVVVAVCVSFAILYLWAWTTPYSGVAAVALGVSVPVFGMVLNWGRPIPPRPPYERPEVRELRRQREVLEEIRDAIARKHPKL
jgi:hypothetical protein